MLQWIQWIAHLWGEDYPGKKCWTRGTLVNSVSINKLLREVFQVAVFSWLMTRDGNEHRIIEFQEPERFDIWLEMPG